MDELRVNAAVQELNNMIQYLTQRCINLSGDVASLKKEIESLKPVKEEQPTV